MFANTNSRPLILILPPTLIQDTISGGVPDTLHIRVKFRPSIMFTFSIGCMAEGTANKHNKLLVNIVNRASERMRWQGAAYIFC